MPVCHFYIEETKQYFFDAMLGTSQSIAVKTNKIACICTCKDSKNFKIPWKLKIVCIRAAGSRRQHSTSCHIANLLQNLVAIIQRHKMQNRLQERLTVIYTYTIFFSFFLRSRVGSSHQTTIMQMQKPSTSFMKQMIMLIKCLPKKKSWISMMYLWVRKQQTLVKLLSDMMNFKNSSVDKTSRNSD